MKRVLTRAMISLAFLGAMMLLVCAQGGQRAIASPPAQANASPKAPQGARCSECHSCQNPTAANSCLAPCPRPMPSEGPNVVLLKELSKDYQPVIFAHRLHAQMSGLSGGCAECHHNNPTGKILACSNCHSATQAGTLLKPNLTGAYHRNCLQCHREWNQNTKCAVCHELKTAQSVPVSLPASGDIMGSLHPDVQAPVVKMFDTSYPMGSKVTFPHQEHVQRFGLQCADCHQKEDCGDCHHTAETASEHVKNLDEMHAVCANCHQTTGGQEVCARCHSNQQLPSFSHKQVGLELSSDHQIAKCTDCHVGAKYNQKPTCKSCHGTDVSYPAQLPGTKVKTP